MLEYRRIRPMDVQAISRLAMRAVSCAPYEVSLEKIVQMATFFAVHHEHFQLAAFDGDEPVAGVAMLVTEMPIFKGGEGTIAFCFSERPGAGRAILRRLMQWVQADTRIKRVSWGMNAGFDPRIAKVAQRIGFGESFNTFMYQKGA